MFGANPGLYYCNRTCFIRTLLAGIMIHMWLRIFSILLVLWASQLCGAQTLYDKSNMLIGRIESDGFVYNRSNITVGRFKSDGWIVDRANMTIGRIMSDNRIVDRSNMAIGKVESNGYVKDRSNMTIGRVKPDGYVLDKSNVIIGKAKDTPTAYVAVFFFFKLFE